MKKIIYGLFITLALIVLNVSVVLADANSPDCTDTPPPPVETDEPTPTSAPTETPFVPTETATFIPLSEPTPTVEVDPTPTPEKGKGRPSSTPDCEDYENNKDKCLAPTGIGDSILMLLFGAVGGLMLLGLIVLLRTKRNGGTLV